VIVLIGALLALSLAQAPPVTAAKHEEPVPSAVASAVAGALAPGGIRATVNGTSLTFWWVRALPLKGTNGPLAWTDVDEGALVGLVSIDHDFRDIRGRVIKTGIYTLRYGIQPANGDHLGVSPFRDFLLLSPVAQDASAAPLGHEGAVNTSKQTIGGSHPAVWSLDPPTAADPPLSTHTTDLGHTAVIVEVPATRGGTAAGVMRFGIVLVGKIEA